MGDQHVRNTDPFTSKEAAERALSRVDPGLYYRMLQLAEAFRLYRDEDFCQDEMAEYYTSVYTETHVHTYNNVRRRTTDLERLGWLVVTGRKTFKGTSRQTYALTDEGKKFMVDYASSSVV